MNVDSVCHSWKSEAQDKCPAKVSEDGLQKYFYVFLQVFTYFISFSGFGLQRKGGQIVLQNHYGTRDVSCRSRIIQISKNTKRMLLRIDVFPHTFSANEGDPVSPQQPLYVCLAATSSSSATVLTVGRTAGDVVFSADKSVSRKHMSLTFKTNQEFHQDNDDGCAVPQKATTPEEIEACEASDNGICVVLTDSSKFGTFLVVEDKDSKKKGGQDDEEEETGDEETDDEGDGGIATNALSQVAAKLVSNATKSGLRRLESKSSLVLSELSRTNGRVLIQCGQNGSLLVVKRIPLNIAFSRIDKATQRLWTQRFYALGASHVETLDKSLSYLVVANRISNAKSLIAWSLKKPMVTIGFLESMLSRKSAKDPFPKTANHLPDPGDKETFWDNATPNPKLLSHCALLSYARDDMEGLASAAGAVIVPLYANPGNASATIENAKEEHSGCFYVGSSAQKNAKLIRLLKKSRVPTVTQKLLASCVSTQLPLKDVDGDIIGKPFEKKETPLVKEEQEAPATTNNTKKRASKQEPENQDAMEIDGDEADELPSTKRRSRRKRDQGSSEPEQQQQQQPKSQRASRLTSQQSTQAVTQFDKTQLDKTQIGSVQKPAETLQLSRQGSQQSLQAKEEESTNDPPTARQEEHNELTESQSSRKRSLQEDSKADEEEGASQRSKRGRVEIAETPSSSEKQDGANDPIPESEKSGVERPASQQRSETSTWTTKKAAPRRDQEGDCAPEGERENLHSTSDGWLIAAPSGSKRTRFRRSDNEVRDLLGGEQLPPCAASEVRKDLVKAPKAQPTRKVVLAASVKDFKRFRKNEVPTTGLPRIRMRSVLPKESDVQRQMEDEQRRLEAQQRKMDALFEDRSNSIRSHMKPRRRNTRRV